MVPDPVLHALRGALGLPSLPWDAMDACGVVVDGVPLDLQWREASRSLCLASVLGHVVAARRAELVPALLLANLAHSENGLPCFALAADGARVVLTEVVAGLVGPQVEGAIDRFVRLSRALREHLGRQQLLAA